MENTIRKVKGTIGRIVFSDNDFVIAVFRCEDGEEIKVKGEIPECRPGMNYEIEAQLTDHPKFGPSYDIVVATPDLPTTEDAIAETLTTVPGIGRVLAAKIVTVFGKGTIDAILGDPDEAAKQVPGLSQKRSREAAEMLSKRKAEIDALIKLRTLLRKTPPHVIKRVVSKWRGHGATIVQENPYRLTEIHGIGFKTADDVAMDMGVKKDDTYRIHAGIQHVIGESRNKGHTIHGAQEVVDLSLSLLSLNQSPQQIAETGEKVYEIIGANPDDFLLGEETIQLSSDARIEAEVAQWVAQRVGQGQQEILPLGDIEPPAGLAPDQIEAFNLIRQHPRLCLLTGAPGTGKTWLVKAVIEAGDRQATVLAAPTGKAAKRMTEATGFPATTIHRLLKARPAGDEGWTFEHCKDNPIPARRIIIDEFSMVDLRLASELFDAIDEGTSVLIVGDNNQLPSVGPGAVLRDMLQHPGLPRFELTEIKRQDPGDIILACHAIRDGVPIDISAMNRSDLFLKRPQAENQDSQLALILDTYLRSIPDMLNRKYPGRYGDPHKPAFWHTMVKNIQILSPFRDKGAVSCKELNAGIREVLFNRGALEQVEKLRYAIGERIIQLKNDYDRNIFNGDVGTVVDIVRNNNKRWMLKVDWDSNEEGESLIPAGSNIDYAYALTVHKSQGSDWPIIIIPLVKSPFFGRQLLYTAISRGKAMVALLGEFSSLAWIAANTQSSTRRTALVPRLIDWSTDDEGDSPNVLGDAPVEKEGAEQ